MFRGGQVFCVCPRIDDLQRVYDRLTVLVPDARILSAHGRMPAAELDDVMTRFADGEADILLSTNIVESGIGAPAIICIGRVVLMRQCLDWIGQMAGEPVRDTDPLGVRAISETG